jgi:lipoate-protein ligase B
MRSISFNEPINYDEARKLQHEFVQKRIADEIPDTLLFLEHLPSITQGQGLQRSGDDDPSGYVRHRARPEKLPPGVDFFESERGGDLTVHSPGQLVVYPIFRITDLGLHIRSLEKAATQAIQGLGPEFQGLKFVVRPKATGVWIDRGVGTGLKKIGSIGIAVKSWVTYHGLSINVVNDLSLFQLISPCGFESGVMTRLKDMAPERGDLWENGVWRERLMELITQGLK